MIAKTVLQYWNTLPLPDDINSLRKTWFEHNSDYNIALFDHPLASSFIKQQYGTEIEQLFQRCALPAMQSDMFRLAYCLAKGGMYIDMATKCHQSISALFSNPNKLTVMRKWHGGIWNGLIICEAGNQTLNKIWEKVLSNVSNERFDDVWKATGPFSFNEVIDKHEKVTINDEVHVMLQEETRPYFDLINDLEHKKKTHWSEVQKNLDIYSGNNNESG